MQRAQPSRQPFELSGVQRRETPAHRELRSVRLGEAELTGPHERAGERRVASAGAAPVAADADGLRGLGEIEREPLGRPVEAGDEAPHQPGRARPHDAEPEQLDVVGPGVEAERVDHRIDPGHHLHHVARQHERDVRNLRRHISSSAVRPRRAALECRCISCISRSDVKGRFRASCQSEAMRGPVRRSRPRPGVGAAGATRRRVDRRRHLDRFRHPRLSGAKRGLDQESRGREDGHPAALHGRPRDSEAGVARSSRLARLERRAECGPSRDRRAREGGEAPRRRDPERRRAAPTGRHRSEPGDRGARHHAHGHVHELRRDRADGAGARESRRGGGRSRLPQLRRHLEVRDDLVRSVARARGDRPGLHGGRGGRRRARGRHDAGRVSRRERGADRQAQRRFGDHPERRADRDGRPRGRGASGLDQRRAALDRCG